MYLNPGMYLNHGTHVNTALVPGLRRSDVPRHPERVFHFAVRSNVSSLSAHMSMTTTIPPVAAELVRIVDTVAVRLRALDEPAVSQPRTPGKWSQKEILGHLVDSATNNLHRFVRAQEVDTFTFPAYAQDHWVSVQHYRESPWLELIDLWRLLNRHLAQVITHVPEERFTMTCTIGSYNPCSLEFLIDDHLAHMKHHLRQIGVV